MFIVSLILFVGGMLLQVLGCGAIAGGSVAGLYWGLSLFLTGSGLNVTCINMMLTQRFAPEDDRREGAFLWNYAGMNIGFFVGFTVAGGMAGGAAATIRARAAGAKAAWARPSTSRAASSISGAPMPICA